MRLSLRGLVNRARQLRRRIRNDRNERGDRNDTRRNGNENQA